MKYKYIEAFMDMTERFALTSEANRLKVGACLLKNGNPVAFGVNGTPPGWPTNECEDANGKTKPEVLHAEVQALNKLRKIGESSIGMVLLVTHSPCIRCAHEIVDAGIVEVIYKYDFRDSSGVDHLKKNGIKVIKFNEI